MLDELACRFGWSLEVMARTTVRFEHCGGCGTNGRWSARTRAPSHHPIRAGAKVNGPSGPDNNIVLGIETSNTIPQAPLVNRRLSTAVWVSTAVQVDGERSSPPTASSAIPSFSWDDSMRNRAKHGLARLIPPERDRRKARGFQPV